MDNRVREFIVNLAMKFQGIPYIWGGSNPHVGFDCSGFIIWILQVFNVLPSGDWTAAGFRSIFVVTDNPQPGDLVLYGKPNITHIMMYTGNNTCIGGSGGDHTTVDEKSAKAKNAMVKIKPVGYRSDFVEFLDISKRV